MEGYLGANIILDDNDQTRNFARNVIRELSKNPADHYSLLDIARKS